MTNPSEAPAGRLSITAIMPVLDGMGYLPRSLPAVMALVRAGVLDEFFLVDDGSSDGTGDYAREAGATVLTTAGRTGPGQARNLAAAQATSDVLLFVDADVVIHEDAPQIARDVLVAPDVVAVFGSYDDVPPDPAFASQYMNLRHHYVHHRNAGETDTFWAGCGAIRREAFLAVGGYDAARYDRPSIEDIELGYRLRDGHGRIRIEPRMQGTHLKEWTTQSVVRTDVFQRAIPWSRLLVAGASRELNVTGNEQAKAALALTLGAALLGALVGWLPVWPLALLALAAGWVNRGLFEVFRRRRGVPFAVGAIAFHQLYYVYSSAAYIWCWLELRLGLAPTEGARP